MSEEKSEELKPCLFCKHTPKVYPIDPEEEGDAFGEVRCVNIACPVKPIIKSYDVDEELGTEFHKTIAINKWNTRVKPTFTKEDVEKAAEAIFQEYYSEGCGSNKDTYETTPQTHKINLRRNARAALNAVGRVEE